MSKSHPQNTPKGTRERYRVVVTAPVGEDAIPCEDMKELEPCPGLELCPLDCAVSEWTNALCTKTCGGGQMVRTRTVIQERITGGKPCPHLEEAAAGVQCAREVCPADCEVSEWTDFAECSIPCGGEGKKTRRRDILVDQAGEGKECPHLEETVSPCGMDPCAEDCELSDWSVWSECTATCLGGIRRRSRRILKEPKLGGERCGAIEQDEYCGYGDCPLDCTMTDWSEWSECPVTCVPSADTDLGSMGQRRRTRQVLQGASKLGNKCPHDEETQECNAIECPLDCELSEWSGWFCSADCGAGELIRRRMIKREVIDGVSCGENVDLEETYDFYKVQRERSNTIARMIRLRRNFYGSPSTANLGQSRAHLIARAAETLGLSREDATAYVTGNENALAMSSNPTFYGQEGELIQGTQLPPDAQCAVTDCKQHCLMSEWSATGECSTTCGGGTLFRTREILRHPGAGGRECQNLSEEVLTIVSVCRPGQSKVLRSFLDTN